MHPLMVLSAMVRERDKSVGILLGGGRAIITLRAAERDRVLLLLPSVFLFCFLSEALEFPAGDFYILPVTVLRISTLFFQIYTWVLLRVFWTVDTSFMPVFTKLKNVCEPGSDLIWPMRRCSCQKVRGQIECEGVPREILHSHGVSVELTDGEAVSTENNEDHVIFFSKEQFNAGLRFPLPSLFKEFLHFSQIPPAYIHPNMLCRLPSVHAAGDQSAGLNQRGCQGPCAGEGHMSGFRDAFGQALRSQPIAEGPWYGQNKRGKLVEWVEKASFDRLNRLFEIAAAERSCGTLLFCAEPPLGHEGASATPGTSKARLTDREVKRKEGLLRKTPGGKRSAPSPVGAPAKKKKKKVSLNGKEVKLLTPPKEFVIPHVTYEKEVTIQEPENPLPPSISSGPGHVAGLNHSGPSLSAAAHLALLAEEAASINTPGSPHPDAIAAEAVCANVSPLMATPMEEMRAESQSLPSIGQAFLPFYRKPSKSTARSVQDDHPEGSETEMANETVAVPVVVRDEGTPGETHPTPFSYAELEEKLKQIPPGSTTAMPSAKMFEVVETLVSGLRGMRKNSENQLRLRLEEAEASLSTARGDNEALRADLAEARNREESMDARLHEAEDEVALLRGEVRQLRTEVRQLRTEVSIEKKQKEDLQLRLSAQKRRARRNMAIKRDVPSIPPGEEKKLLDKPAP
ncbi:hypothetical protein CK203_008717 [Vitis vinifera]|uniref:Uncharacterized protein n=1 Tax=Vitis vinifera TaxID=29760 RepID=A0A438KDT5_VITVI|nr:hypothetical protein CK203_008717 [Vitis vinifera]